MMKLALPTTGRVSYTFTVSGRVLVGAQLVICRALPPHGRCPTSEVRRNSKFRNLRAVRAVVGSGKAVRSLPDC